jgi:hypothetical protein
VLFQARLSSCDAWGGLAPLRIASEETFKYFAGMVLMDRAGRNWIMSTQRRKERFSLATKVSRLRARLRSWHAGWKNRAVGMGNEFPCFTARNLNAHAMSATAPLESSASAATNSLQTDHRYQQAIRPVHLPPGIRLGSPPLGEASVQRPSCQRSPGYPLHLPADCSRFHRSLPWAPAALCRRTERYDGKRDLHFKHAA